MARGNAAAAQGVPDISHAAARALIYMARMTRDADSPPVYWGGWADLATLGMGYREYDRKAQQAVRRAIRELLEAGIIKVVRPPSPGKNTEYALYIPLR